VGVVGLGVSGEDRVVRGLDDVLGRGRNPVGDQQAVEVAEREHATQRLIRLRVDVRSGFRDR
jgi:hypothetical protein